jgi:S-sulfo-L-cysteine synthase (O-acetyl-L-serine-dependent)
VDRILSMPTDEAWDTTDQVIAEEGIFLGHSGGAGVAGALRVAKEHGPGACVVTILPDRGDRYFAPLRWEKRYVW